jgi:hypothetical protein
MPVDELPHPEGNVAIHSDGQRGAVLTAAEIEEVKQLAGSGPPALHRSHFVTCPQAADHRKRKRVQTPPLVVTKKGD